MKLYQRGSFHFDFSLVRPAVVAFFGVLSLFFVLDIETVSRPVFLSFSVLSPVVLSLSRSAQFFGLSWTRGAHFEPYRILLIGEPKANFAYLSHLASHPEWGIQVVASLSDQGGRDDSAWTLDGLSSLLASSPIDEVYWGQEPVSRLAEVIALCEELGITLSLDPHLFSKQGSLLDVVDLSGWRVLMIRGSVAGAEALWIKRLVDVIGAVTVGALLLPLWVMVVALLKFVQGGPVLFRQERVGLQGRSFTLLKFRTMVEDAEALVGTLKSQNEATGPVFKMHVDPRVTPLGWWLRRTSIDEFPQLWNVLLGEMSLVGPRPALPCEVACYERWQRRRLSMRPGMTCIWQVSGRSEISFERWVQMDLQYIDNWSLFTDFSLMLRTIPAVFLGTGAR